MDVLKPILPIFPIFLFFKQGKDDTINSRSESAFYGGPIS